jgi:hypothetical protein
MTISLLGWVATGVFATSYLFRRAETLTRIQAAAACLWIIYGIAIGAVPVVVANLIVAGAALYSSFRRTSVGTTVVQDSEN